MKLLVIISYIMFLCCCSTKIESHVIVKQKSENTILRNLINSKKIKGTVLYNKFDDSAIDSFVNLYVSFPFEQSYPIDSIYFLFVGDETYKILAQSEFEKGLLYLEVDKNGNHTRAMNFGGYVLNVYNVKTKDSKSQIELSFVVDTWGSTMPDTITQFIKIFSNPKDIDFKIMYKNNDKWVQVDRD